MAAAAAVEQGHQKHCASTVVEKAQDRRRFTVSVTIACPSRQILTNKLSTSETAATTAGDTHTQTDTRGKEEEEDGPSFN